MGTLTKRIILERIAGISVLSLFIFRFIFPGDIPFILDEPQLQLILDHHFSNGTIPLRGLDGSQGLAYGQIPLWIYGVIRFFTDQVIDIGILHNLIFTSTLIIGFYFCRRHLNRGSDIWFLIFGLLSPLLSFYARLPWDNTFQFFFSALLIWITFSEYQKKHFLGGLVSGLLFCTHLMSAPLILVSALIKEISFKNLLARALGFMIPTIIYLPTLVRGVFHGNPRQPIPWWDALRNLPRDILYSFQPLSVMRMKYFTVDSLSHFFRTIPFDIYWIILPLVVYMGFRFLNDPQFKSDKTKGIFKYFTLCIGAHSIYFFILKVDATHPHYFMPIFIPALLLFSNLIVLSFRHQSNTLKTVLSVGLGVMMTHLLAYQLTFRSYTLENGGMRDLHVGPSVSTFQNFIQNLCMDSIDSEIKIDLSLIPTVFPKPLEYQFKHHAACTGKKLSIGGGGAQVDFDSSNPRSTRLILRKSGSG